jgi:hypothetical protein
MNSRLTWLSGNFRDEEGNRGCRAGKSRPTPPYLPLYHGDTQRTVNLDDDHDEYCDKIFKIASGKQGRLSLTSE